MMTPGNDRDLRKLRQMVGLTGITVLALHCYLVCYRVFVTWGLSGALTDRLLSRLGRMGPFYGFHRARLLALVPLILSAAGGNRDSPGRPGVGQVVYTVVGGAFLFFGAPFVFYGDFSSGSTAVLYMAGTGVGAMLIYQAAGLVWNRYWPGAVSAIFNDTNESFPQEERPMVDADSTNFRTEYRVRGRVRKGWINIDPFRGLLVMGSPGSGKSFVIVREVVREHIAKGYSMVLYDFKYDELTLLAYNCFLKYKGAYPVEPRFYVINFDDPAKSHRCNPLQSDLLIDIADAANAARTILLGLNRDWIERQGDFWNESAISFLTALIWYLKKFKGGIYCTLPHVIELLQTDYSDLFSILRTEPEIRNYISPMVTAYMNQVTKTVDNQISSLKIAINRLSSPALYYILTGNDFTLDINNPLEPKILCLGNSPQRSGVYGAALSLYVSTINRLCNQKGKMKSSHIYDEMTTVYIHQLHEVLATGRGHKLAFTLCVQNIEQMRLNYGKNQAEVIANLPSSVMTGQNTGDSARLVSEAVGRILQERKSVHYAASDDSVTAASSLDYAVPISRIAGLSAGEFVGFVADNPARPIVHKAFDARVLVSDRALDERDFDPLPVVRTVSAGEIAANFDRVRQEVEALVSGELSRMLKTVGLANLVISKPGG